MVLRLVKINSGSKFRIMQFIVIVIYFNYLSSTAGILDNTRKCYMSNMCSQFSDNVLINSKTFCYRGGHIRHAFWSRVAL